MKKFDPREPMVRLREALANHEYHIFTLLKKHGDGFVAVPRSHRLFEQNDSVVVRKQKDGTVLLQPMENPGVSAATINLMFDWSNNAFALMPFAFNQGQAPGLRWEQLVRSREVREHERLWGTRVVKDAYRPRRTRPKRAKAPQTTKTAGP